MSEILGDEASRIVKRILGFRKTNSMLGLIRQVLSEVSLEADLRLRRSLH
jgi:hypothetical protein